MFGTGTGMDLVIQYELQAASGLLILGIGAFLAKSAGRHTHKTLGKIEREPPVRLLCGSVWYESHSNSLPTNGNPHAQRKLLIPQEKR